MARCRQPSPDRRFRPVRTALLFAVLALLAGCGAPAALPATPTPLHLIVPVGLPTITPTAAPALRVCDYIPGQSKPAMMPPEVLNPQPTASPTPLTFQAGQVSATVTAQQIDLFNQLRKDVDQFYADTNPNGLGWAAITKKYEAIIQAGLSEADFLPAMQQMLGELDGSSFIVQSPSESSGTPTADTSSYVGLGFDSDSLPGQPNWLVTVVFPNSPAARAGIKPHDRILAADNGPMWDTQGSPATRGPKGTTVTLRVQSPGQAPRDVAVTRDTVDPHFPADECMVSGTRIAYLRLPDMTDQSGVESVNQALHALEPYVPLDGLIIDTRGVGFSFFGKDQMSGHMAFFLSGQLGSFVTRQNAVDISVSNALDIAESQTVPLVVLVDETSSVSGGLYGSILQQAGRAKIVGQTVTGPMFMMQPFDLSGKYTLYLPTGLWQPVGKPKFTVTTHLEPDVSIPARWDLFTPANDPQLAKAVDLLKK